MRWCPKPYKSLPVSSSFFTLGRPYAPSRSQLFHCVEGHVIPYVKQHCSLLLFTAWEAAHLTRSRSIAAKSSRFRPASWGPTASIWRIEDHPHIQLSLGHGSDTTGKDLGHLSQKVNILGREAQIFIYQRPIPMSS